MPSLASNKRAVFDYTILETFEAGLELAGYEVKSIKTGRARLQGVYAIIRGEEAYIVGMHIPPYQQANMPPDYDPDRTRRLLLRKVQIRYLLGKMSEKGLTLVPIQVYTKHGFIKVELGLGRGKKAPDKRQKIREREENRRIERSFKNSP